MQKCFYCNVLWVSIFLFFKLGIWESAFAWEFKTLQFPASFKVKSLGGLGTELLYRASKGDFFKYRNQETWFTLKYVINLLHKLRLIHIPYSVLKQCRKVYHPLGFSGYFGYLKGTQFYFLLFFSELSLNLILFA